MQRTTLVKYVHFVPKALSLFGLLGLAGAAGIIDPRYFWLSFLSFLSYLNYFRFFLGFFDPQYRVKPERVLLATLPMFPIIIVFALAQYVPALGFFGFLGYVGLTVDKTSQVHGST